MKRHVPQRFQPRVEALEERAIPGTVYQPLGVPPTDPLAPPFVAGDVPQTDYAAYSRAASLPARNATGAADAHAQPFKIDGGGPAPQGLPLVPGTSAPHQATGNANYLGHYTSNGLFTLGSVAISPTGAVTGTFQGTCVFVAANGDHMATTYGDGFTGTFTGQLNATGTAVDNLRFDAVFKVDPVNSTGRFAGATGSWRMIANASEVSLIYTTPGYTAHFNYTWSGSGSITFVHGNS